MEWHYGPFAVPLVVSAIIALAAGIVALRRRPVPGTTSFAALMFLLASWPLANTLELGYDYLPTKLFWANVQYLAIVAAPVLWLVFTMQYVSSGDRPKPLEIAKLSIIPIITFILVWTNPWHGLMRQNVTLDTNGAWSIVSKTYGPWFWVHTVYSYGLIGAGAVVFWRGLPTGSSVYRQQRLLVGAGLLIFAVSNAMYLTVPRGILRLDISPIALIALGLATGLGAYRYHLLDLVPIARDTLINQTATGFIIVDLQDRIVDMNPAAERATGWRRDEALGHRLDKVPCLHGLGAEPLQSGEERDEIRVCHDSGEVYYRIEKSPLSDRRGRRIGYTLALRDVTRAKQEQAERERLIAQLQETIAEIRTLSGLLPICASCKRIRDDEGYWRQVEDYIASHSNAEFTHSICPDCMKRLYGESADEEQGVATDSANAPSGTR